MTTATNTIWDAYVNRPLDEWMADPPRLTAESISTWLDAMRDAGLQEALALIDAMEESATAAGATDLVAALGDAQKDLEAALERATQARWRALQIVGWSDAAGVDPFSRRMLEAALPGGVSVGEGG